MKGNKNFGAFFAILGILAGLLTLYFLASTYNNVIHTHFAEGSWEESNTVRIVYAVLGWFGISAGAISAAVLWGFLTERDWAWLWGAERMAIARTQLPRRLIECMWVDYSKGELMNPSMGQIVSGKEITPES